MLLKFKEELVVKAITYKECLPFILNIHYARRTPVIQYAYGLYYKSKLIGVVTYGQLASPSACKGVAGDEYKNNVLELNRLVILPEYNGKNFASILVSRSLKLLPKDYFIVSYADYEGWGHIGYVYQATNWLYTGMTHSRTDKCGDGHPRHYEADETRRKYRTAKHRYIYITGNRKKLIKKLKYPIYSKYPKGDSIHYDTNNPISILEHKEE